ncbi:MAG: CHAT domain-containing protein [Bryobacteraceae bacterium]|jgi:CHAT domain-containing protein/tetratricopeptide (TPR) repeat protein
MQTKGLLVCLVLLLPSVGTVRKPAAISPGKERSGYRESPAAPELLALSERAKSLVSAGDYLQAAEVNRKGYAEATARSDPRQALRFLGNAGSCWFALSRHRRAMDAYLEARKLAGQIGDWEVAGALSMNISSLYLQMGEVSGAGVAAREGLAALQKLPSSKYRIRLLVQAGEVKTWQGDVDGAIPVFGQAIAEAERQGDLSSKAQACNLLGYGLLRSGRVEAAAAPLLEAFRLRQLIHDRDIDSSYRTVGLLRMAQGDLKTAGTLLDQAVALAAAKPGPVPRWHASYFRGQVRMAQGNLEGAVADFRTAMDLARRWRLEVIPADAVRVSLEVGLQQLYAGFIQAANQLYLATRQASLLRESFEAAEENRAASLRALVTAGDDWRRGLPEEYDQVLARLRGVEVSLLREDSPAARTEAQRLRYALMQMEAKAGLDFGYDPGGRDNSRLLERTVQALDRSEVLMSFHLGEPDSWVWAVTREGIELHRLSGRSRIATEARQLTEAVKSGSAAAPELGKTLYDSLLGGLGKAARSKPHWSLALDDALFSVPFAALVPERGPDRPVYLVERHSVRLVPSAHLIADRLAAARETAGATRPGAFVAVGDPIYNTADPRWRQSLHRAGRDSVLQLPRLVGSGREIRSCASAWDPGAPPVLLEGPEATRAALSKALDGAPPVLHLATHVVSRPHGPAQGMVALSLLPDGEPDFLSPADIATWRVNVGLVVLSGCSSGLGEALPGTGLMGLTRAWLAAGADAVTASLWPAPDDTGELFLSFYRHLREGAAQGGRAPAARYPRAAVALERAQIDMLHSGTWRSLPKYWAGYFLLGKE